MTTIAAASAAHLLTHGPCTEQEVHQALLASGLTKARTSSGVRNALMSAPEALPLPDGRWEHAARLLAGCVLTVRPRSKLTDGVLWTHDDLLPFDLLLDRGPVPLAGGGEVRRGRHGHVRTLLGPPGWLPQPWTCELLALRWTGSALQVFPVDEVVEDSAVQVVRDLIHRHRSAMRSANLRTSLSWEPEPAPPSLLTVLLSALRECPDLLRRPLPPLSEILAIPTGTIWDEELWAPVRGQQIRLTVPTRVVEELERRSRLLGESAAHHAAVLLGAAVDRVLPGAEDAWREPRYGLEAYDEDWATYEADSVVRPLRQY